MGEQLFIYLFIPSAVTECLSCARHHNRSEGKTHTVLVHMEPAFQEGIQGSISKQYIQKITLLQLNNITWLYFMDINKCRVWHAIYNLQCTGFFPPSPTCGCQESAGEQDPSGLHPPRQFSVILSFLLITAVHLFLPPPAPYSQGFHFVQENKGNFFFFHSAHCFIFQFILSICFKKLHFFGSFIFPHFLNFSVLILRKNMYHPVYKLTQGFVSSSSEECE